jgi:hypothetical protein
MTVVYDMVEGHLIWVETGRTSDVLSSFLKQLPTETAAGIEAFSRIKEIKMGVRNFRVQYEGDGCVLELKKGSHVRIGIVFNCVKFPLCQYSVAVTKLKNSNN